MLHAMICIRINQTIAAPPIAGADAPLFAHGDTAEKPSPVPSASKISDSAAAANAPAKTAGHDTPDEYASFLMGPSARHGVSCATALTGDAI